MRDQATRLGIDNMGNTIKATGSMVHNYNRLSCDGLDDIIICLCWVRVFFGLEARGRTQLALYIYLLYLYYPRVPYNGT